MKDKTKTPPPRNISTLIEWIKDTIVYMKDVQNTTVMSLLMAHIFILTSFIRKPIQPQIYDYILTAKHKTNNAKYTKSVIEYIRFYKNF